METPRIVDHFYPVGFPSFQEEFQQSEECFCHSHGAEFQATEVGGLRNTVCLGLGPQMAEL